MERRTEGSVVWSSCKPSLLASKLVPPDNPEFNAMIEKVLSEALHKQFLKKKDKNANSNV